MVHKKQTRSCCILLGNLNRYDVDQREQRTETSQSMQQTRRRRHHAGTTTSASPVGKTVLPLSTATRGDGGGNNRLGSSSSNSKKRRLLVFVTILVIILFIIAIALSFLLRIDHHPQSLRTTGHGNTQQEVIRISSTDNADMTEFISCIDDVSVEPYFSKIDPVLAEHRHKSRNPAHSELSCSPPNKQHCFRCVYDGFDDLLELAQQHGDGYSGIQNQIAVLIESLILKPGVPLQRDGNHRDALPTILQVSVHRQKTYQTEKTKPTFDQLHADYLESASYVYTAILYDDTPDNLLGGETALVNFRQDDNGQGDVTFGLTSSVDLLPPQQESKSEQPIVFTDGLIVEPKSGRLVLFSSGAENFHAPMAVRQGERPTYHFWFKCKQVVKE